MSDAPVPAGDYLYMYDAIHATADTIPAYAEMVAGYVSGADHSFWWTAADWARWPHAAHVRIDTNGTAPLESDVLDVENGDASVAGAVDWAKTREAHGQWSYVYANASTLPSLQAAMKAAGITKVGYWMADWSLSEAQAAARLGTDGIVAVQYASPSTGAPAGHDVSVSNKTWAPVPNSTPPPVKPPVPPVPARLGGLLITGTSLADCRAVTSSDSGKTWQ